MALEDLFGTDATVDPYAGGIGDAYTGNAISPGHKAAIAKIEELQRPLLERKNKLMEQLYEPDHLSFGGAVAQALVGFLPAILGKTLAGNAGGAIGAKAGLEGLGTYDTISKAYRADQQKQGLAQVKSIDDERAVARDLEKTLLTGGIRSKEVEEQRKYEDTRRRPGGDIYDFELKKMGLENQYRLGQIAANANANDGPPVSQAEVDAAIAQLRRSVPVEQQGTLAAQEAAIRDAAKDRSVFNTHLQKYVPSAGAANQAGYLDLARTKFDSSRNSGELVAAGPNTDPRGLPKAQEVLQSKKMLTYYGTELANSLAKNGVAFFDDAAGRQSQLAAGMINALRLMDAQGANFTGMERASNIQQMLSLPDTAAIAYATDMLRGISQENKLQDFLRDLNYRADSTLGVLGYKYVPSDANPTSTMTQAPSASSKQYPPDIEAQIQKRLNEKLTAAGIR